MAKIKKHCDHVNGNQRRQRVFQNPGESGGLDDVMVLFSQVIELINNLSQAKFLKIT